MKVDVYHEAVSGIEREIRRPLDLDEIGFVVAALKDGHRVITVDGEVFLKKNRKRKNK